MRFNHKDTGDPQAKRSGGVESHWLRSARVSRYWLTPPWTSPTLRLNRFEVGERSVHFQSQTIYLRATSGLAIARVVKWLSYPNRPTVTIANSIVTFARPIGDYDLNALLLRELDKTMKELQRA